MSKKDWTKYATVAFEAMKANITLWATGDPDTQRAVTKIYYDLVFSSGYQKTGLVSEGAVALHKAGKGKQNDDDHILSPQFVARMIMDEPQVWLTDLKKFTQLFGVCRQTILVTSTENHQLRQLTKNDRNTYTVAVPTDKKYAFLNINLMFKVDRKMNSAIQVNQSHIDAILQFPQELLNYESQFVTV